MRQQLELASEFKSDLLDTIDWVKKQLVDFDDGKNNIDSFDLTNNAIDVKMDGPVLEEKSEALTLWLLLQLTSKNWSLIFFFKRFLFSDVGFYLCTAALYLLTADLHRKTLLCLS